MNVIKEFRIKHKLTQVQLAKEIERHPSTIQAYEYGTRNITKDVLFRLEKLEEKYSMAHRNKK